MLDLAAAAGGIKCPTGFPGLMEGAVGAVEVAADVFAFLGGVGGILAMLPDDGEGVELELRDLRVGRVGSLAAGIVHGRALDVSTTGGGDALGPFFVSPPENLIHPVNAPVAERAVGVVEKVAEALGMDF